MTLLLVLALLPLLLLSAFFSSSETVLFSLSGAQRARIRALNPQADVRIGRCLDDKAVLFSTLLVGNTLVNFAIAAIGYRLLARQGSLWALLAVPLMTLVLLVFGEITPKRLALRYAERIAPACARLLVFWRFLFTPFNRLLGASARAFAPALERERRALSDEELVSVLENAAEHGELKAADAEMVEGVLRLSELCANDEMTPRVDIEGLDLELCPDAAAQAAVGAKARHHRLPAFRRTPDAIESVYDARTGEFEEPLFVPEFVALDDLLVTFVRSGRQLAVVLDEYGGTAGIITVRDVLELIVGPSVFGDLNAEPQLREVGRDVWEIDARASLDEINRQLDLELEAEDADRLSGWVQFHAERLPHVGQQLEADGCRATVLKRRHRRVTLVRLEVLRHPEAATDEAILADTDEAVERTEEDDA